jgi:hypothetical protein
MRNILRSAAITALISTAGIAFGTTLTPAPSVSAWCYTTNDPRNIGVSWGAEQPSGGTCDDDGTYRGGVYDDAPDGQCVYVAVNINGTWNYTYARSCLTSGTSYNFTDSNHYSPTYIRKANGSAYTPQVGSDNF